MSYRCRYFYSDGSWNDSMMGQWRSTILNPLGSFEEEAAKEIRQASNRFNGVILKIERVYYPIDDDYDPRKDQHIPHAPGEEVFPPEIITFEQVMGYKYGEQKPNCR